MATTKKGVKKKVASSVSVRFHAAVQQDLQEAYDYYEEQRKGLGEEFLTELTASLDYLQKHAALFQVVAGNTRKYNISKFPYGIFYLLTGKEIFVTAIIHLMRNPKKWKSRK